MCAKKSFQTIKESTDLKFSKGYGDGTLKGRRIILEPAKFRRDFQVPGILGYTGERPKKPLTNPPSSTLEKGMASAIPGYTGYVPLKGPESVIGRRFAAVTAACMQHVHSCFYICVFVVIRYMSGVNLTMW